MRLLSRFTASILGVLEVCSIQSLLWIGTSWHHRPIFGWDRCSKCQAVMITQLVFTHQQAFLACGWLVHQWLTEWQRKGEDCCCRLGSSRFAHGNKPTASMSLVIWFWFDHVCTTWLAWLGFVLLFCGHSEIADYPTIPCLYKVIISYQCCEVGLLVVS